MLDFLTGEPKAKIYVHPILERDAKVLETARKLLDGLCDQAHCVVIRFGETGDLVVLGLEDACFGPVRLDGAGSGSGGNAGEES